MSVKKSQWTWVLTGKNKAVRSEFRRVAKPPGIENDSWDQKEEEEGGRRYVGSELCLIECQKGREFGGVDRQRIHG